MFEKEIKFIGDFSFNQVRSLGSNFTLDKIVATGIHPAIVQYISAELEFMIYSDRRKLLSQSYFDYTGKEISDHFQKISGEIKKHKKISIDDAKKLIFQAVSFNINYLVRPRWSLTKLIFNEQPVISSEEMKMMFNYLYYYEYFKKVLIGYITKRDLVQLSSTEFEIILDKIDNELLNSSQQQVVSNSFTSMGDFFNIGGVDKNLLPLSAVEIFCKEKNLLDLIVKLRKVIPNDVKRRYDKVEIERILFSTQTLMKDVKSSGLETEIKTEEMLEKIDAAENQTTKEEESAEPTNELQKTDIETFLTPDEEEALLSLYSEESKEIKEEKVGLDVAVKPEIKTESEEIKSEIIESDTLAFENIEQINVESEVEEEQDYSETTTTAETGLETIESIENKFAENIIDTDEELEEIYDAITDESKVNDELIEKLFIDDVNDSVKSEIENQTEDVETDLFKSGIEKEIVQEMIKDFYGEKEPDISSVEEIENMGVEQAEEIIDEPVNQEPRNKIESLEDELLNIFEDLDNVDFGLPEKVNQFEHIDNNLISEAEKNIKNEPAVVPAMTDSFDDYLKSIDELMFAEKTKKTIIDKKQVEVKSKINEPEKKTEVQESIIPPEDREDKTTVIPRNIRPKDLFSYLRKKEVKKIVFFIFANDEEDFTNTIERLMDCHSYKEASEILKAVFTSYKISPYSKEAITFTNAVSNYFRQA
ncbi:MAG: hypothetical protein MUE64_02000 [Ignavibacteriaceae bacterium]|nr:hypothetical protein [Ignavibacteriaceae bacterium]